MGGTPSEIQFLVRLLNGYHADCTDAVVDLAGAKFNCTDTSMSLTLQDSPFVRNELFFRMNQNDPKDSLAIHAHKQLCQLIGVPYKFFADNRPVMRESIVREWLASLVPGDDKSLRMVKVRNCREVSIIRAILPKSCLDYPNYRAVQELTKDYLDFDMSLTSTVGDEMDAAGTEILVKVGPQVEWVGSSYRLGMLMSINDLDNKPIRVQCKLVAEGDSEAYTVTFEHGHMLELPYTAMSPLEMDKVLHGLAQQVMDRSGALTEKLLLATSKEYLGIDASLDMVAGLVKSKSVISKIRREFLRTGADSEYTDTISFARGLASVAKSYGGPTRDLLEGVAGYFLGLDLPAIVKETKKEGT